MKKINIVLCALCMGILMISGCGSSEPEEVTNQEFTLKLDSGNLEGTYTGTVIGKKPNGTGTFTADSNGSIIKYEGEWAKGKMNGSIICTKDDKILFNATFDNGKISSINREKSSLTESDLTQICSIEEDYYCLKLPEGWSYEELDEPEISGRKSSEEILIKNPDDECMEMYLVVYKTATSMKMTDDTYFSIFKENYGENKVSDDQFAESEDDHLYSHDTYTSDDAITDIYVLKTVPIYNVCDIVLIEENGGTDYSDIAIEISKNLISWDDYQNELEEQEKEREEAELQQLLSGGENGDIDWNGLEEKYKKITARDIIDNTYAYEEVLVEGVVSGLNKTAFNFWMPCDGTFYKNENIHCMNLPEGVTNGMTIELLISTNDVGYLSSTADAARIIETPVYDDIVTEYKNTCPEMDYETIMRNPTAARGTICKVTGTIKQIVESTEYNQKMLVCNADNDYIYISFSRNENDDYLLEGDEISAYGMYYMTQSYTTILGETKTVPKLVADYITIWK